MSTERRGQQRLARAGRTQYQDALGLTKTRQVGIRNHRYRRLLARATRVPAFEEAQDRARKDERRIDARVVGPDTEMHEIVACRDAADVAVEQYIVLAARCAVDVRWNERSFARGQVGSVGSDDRGAMSSERDHRGRAIADDLLRSSTIPDADDLRHEDDCVVDKVATRLEDQARCGPAIETAAQLLCNGDHVFIDGPWIPMGARV